VAIAAREKEAQAVAARYEQLVANLEEENRSVCRVGVLCRVRRSVYLPSVASSHWRPRCVRLVG
jgi:hypothetical protein